MLLTESEYLFAYCSQPSLHGLPDGHRLVKASLTDAELTVNFREETNTTDVVTVIATEPLTDNEEWTALKEGEMITFMLMANHCLQIFLSYLYISYLMMR